MWAVGMVRRVLVCAQCDSNGRFLRGLHVVWQIWNNGVGLCLRPTVSVSKSRHLASGRRSSGRRAWREGGAAQTCGHGVGCTRKWAYPCGYPAGLRAWRRLPRCTSRCTRLRHAPAVNHPRQPPLATLWPSGPRDTLIAMSSCPVDPPCSSTNALNLPTANPPFPPLRTAVLNGLLLRDVAESSPTPVAGKLDLPPGTGLSMHIAENLGRRVMEMVSYMQVSTAGSPALLPGTTASRAM